MYKAFVSFAFLFIQDPETLHRLALSLLALFGMPPLRWFGGALFSFHHPELSQELWGLRFENPVGLAAGFDKNGRAIPGLEALGFGFLEVGTVTTRPQEGNPRQRLFRLPRDRALINRMGFNNAGARSMKTHLPKRHRSPLGISIGKSKIVSLDDAANDYLAAFKTLYDDADYFAVNVSSPNTPGLRDLQDEARLALILDRLNEYRNTRPIRKPLLVKISPDLPVEAIDSIVALLVAKGVDGVIATNTTTSREGLTTPSTEAGGLSGKPLKERSTAIIRRIRLRAPRLPIIGVGGIFTAEDAYEKLRVGANLVQIYTGFVYEGPSTLRNINQGLIRLLKRDGFKNIAEAAGQAL